MSVGSHATAAPVRRPKSAKVADDGSYHARSGRLELYLPPGFEPQAGRYDLVFHFHGLARAQEENTVRAHLNAAIVSINLGVASRRYGMAFVSPRAFDAILARTHRLVAASGRANGAKVGRIALSAWSAGFESVSAILKQDQARSGGPRVDAVLLADGLHAAFTDRKNRVVDERGLGKYAKLGEEAMRGERLFVLTHSSIPTQGYASVAETVGAMLRLLAVEKGPPPEASPRQMRAIYQVRRGDLLVTGFEGHGVSDHIDHIRAMGDTMYPLLAERWARRPAP